MNFHRMQRRGMLALSLASLVAPKATSADTGYPRRSVRIIVGFAPGSSTDLGARFYAQKLTAALRQSFVVDNRPGASGQIATDAVKNADKDGYTLLYSSGGTMAINLALFRGKLRYDTLRDFIPVAGFEKSPLCLVVRAGLPINNLTDMIAYVKARPDQTSFGTSGVGSTSHITMERLKKVAGLQITHVPYRGGGQVLTGLMGGQLDFTLDAMNVILPHRGNSKIRLIAVTSKDRLTMLPEIPTLAEKLPGFEVFVWPGLFAPVGTPAEIVEILNLTVSEQMRRGDYAPAVEDLGSLPNTGNSQQFRAFVQQQIEMWDQVVKLTGVQPE